MKKIAQKVFLIVTLLGFSFNLISAINADYNKVIPLPNKIVIKKGEDFKLLSDTKIVYPKGDNKMKQNAQFLSDYLYELTGKRFKTKTSGKRNAIILKKEFKCKKNEAYQLTVTKKNIVINGTDDAGVFYGIQTLRKATPIEKTRTIYYPATVITDYPRFAYRGMHLDVGRHLFTVDSIKRYIDILALHNINKFHWHLTEDQGWRLEIKKYPKLTEVGAWREQTAIKKFFPGGNPENKFIGDGKRYGGFYTQDEAREIVKYAQKRHITVIPEIDLPGHMLAALASYPELGNDTPPYKVGCWWGVFDQILAPKEETFTFLENVLTEVIDIFPSKYIHIGGDEAPKTEWKKSKQAQEVIKKMGLKDDVVPNKLDGRKHTKEEKLQSYFITRVEKFLNSKGRQIIGWDEILEGQLAPNATVMSWRGMEGGITAAKMNHDVIMTPSSHVYFDHYQSNDTENEPFAIGGFTNVERVYSFNPVPKDLTAEQKKHILGAQANVWTEYIPTFKHVEYMVLPRLTALSEVLWTEPTKRNYERFTKCLSNMIAIYDLKKYNYATHVFDVQAKFIPNPDTYQLDVILTNIDNAPIYYTLDGTEPTKNSIRYTKPFSIKATSSLKAKSIRSNGQESRTFTKKFTVSQSSFKPIKLLTKPASGYAYKGAMMLNDGITGESTIYKSGNWIGFQSENLEVVIDLQQATKISNAMIHTCVVTGDWVLDASEFNISVSDDGENYHFVVGTATCPNDRQKHWKGVSTHKISFKPIKTRFVKVEVKVFDKFPKWHGAQGKPFVFVDEILIN